MHKYVVFYKGRTVKFIKKGSVDHAVRKDLKKQGYRKHTVEVNAENESDAKIKFNAFNSDYLESLREFSGNTVICALIVIALAVIYLVRSCSE